MLEICWFCKNNEICKYAKNFELQDKTMSLSEDLGPFILDCKYRIDNRINPACFSRFSTDDTFK